MTDQGFREAFDATTTRVVDALTRIFGDASPATVFAAPERVGDQVFIPAAAWERVGGFGLGGGVGGEAGKGEGLGAGGGGGGMSQARPVAVIRLGPDGVEVRPVIDLTKVTVTVLLAAIGVWRVLRR
jgi:uncharacterized spore protein YtfJ